MFFIKIATLCCAQNDLLGADENLMYLSFWDDLKIVLIHELDIRTFFEKCNRIVFVAFDVKNNIDYVVCTLNALNTCDALLNKQR